MSKLVIGIVVVAVIVGIFMFSSRDEPALAPRIIKPTNSTNTTFLPDLIISNLTYTYVANGTVTYNSTNFTSYRVFVSATIRNSGNAVAGASSTRMMFSGVNWPNAISTQSFSTSALSAGQSTVVSGTLTGLSGLNRLQADADSGSVIVESNEANNMRVVNATLP
ncbi:MAG: CARDB domain-containing protein [Nanoarchaeota archaeon]